MASPPRHRQLPLQPHLFPILVAAAAFFLATAATTAAQEEGYCKDSLAGLKECDGFMYGGASAAPSPACCAAYEAAFDADPFCLCYVADGTYGRATGHDVDVAHALQIPASCGQGQPPIQLCNMEGLVLPPYAPQGTSTAEPPAAAAAPNAQPPSASGSSLPVAPPTFTSPPPPPTSKAPDLLPNLIFLAAAAAIIVLASR